MEKEVLKKLYYYLHLTRQLENQIVKICQSQNANDPLVIGKGYVSTGQEAVSVGAATILSSSDWLAPGHRDMGAHLIKGVTAKEIFMQYFCRKNSPTQGRDSNMHFGYHKKRITGFVSHMGVPPLIANGLAAAMKYRGQNNLVLTTFGDGASSQGIIHEAMNYAAVFKLPVLFLVNNNRWAISTPIKEQMAIDNLADRAMAYGMPGYVVDGNDAVQVYERCLSAREYILKSKGPVLVEAKTMRICGHGTHDSAGYVPQSEKDQWTDRDPLKIIQAYIESHDLKKWAEKIKIDVALDIEEAWQMASREEKVAPADLHAGVFKEDCHE